MGLLSIGVRQQDAPLGQQPPAMVIGLEGDPLETIAPGPLDPIVSGQGAIDHGEFRIDELQRTGVGPQDLAEKMLGLQAHIILEQVIEVRMVLRVDRHALEPREVQPLVSEIPHELPGARIVQHTLHLATKRSGLPQLAGLRQRKELLIGHRAPQEVGQARGEFPVIEGANPLFPPRFNQVEKLGRHQHQRQRLAHSHLEGW